MKRGTLVRLLTGSLLGLLAAALALTGWGERIENHYALGLLYAVRGPIDPPSGAVVIAIDRDTLATLRKPEILQGHPRLASCLAPSAIAALDKIRGPGSLPRSVHACLLQETAAAGLPVVVFDILFTVAGAPDDDERFAQALRAGGSTALLVGYERSLVKGGGSEMLVEREVRPVPLFEASAAALGTFVVPRTGTPVFGYWGEATELGDTPSLPSEAVRLLRRGAPAHDTGEHDEPFRYLWLYGPPGSILTVSARDVLDGALPDLVGSDAAVMAAFIGASDPGTTNYVDSFPSFFRGPSAADISGVELIATGFLNELHGETLSLISREYAFLLTVLLALAFTAASVWGRRYSMAIVLAGAAAYFVTAALVFVRVRYFLPITGPIFLLAPLMLLAAAVFRYRLARSLIMHLVPRPVARRLLTKPSDERGEASSDEATIVFFDLVGSTKIAEKLSPLAFSELLNAYHETVTRCVSSHKGFIGAFLGDGVMAVFTRADAGGDHAICACKAVLSVLEMLSAAPWESGQEGPARLKLRVGINSGFVAAGEMGSRDRFNFSVVGDVVNLAARLEQLGKTLFPDVDDVVLVGEATRRLAQDPALAFLDCGVRPIPGRELAEHVHRLLPPVSRT